VKLKTGDHREGIKGQKEGKENCRDPSREGKEGRKRKCWGQKRCWVVTRFGKLEPPPNTGQEAKGKERKSPKVERGEKKEGRN